MVPILYSLDCLCFFRSNSKMILCQKTNKWFYIRISHEQIAWFLTKCQDMKLISAFYHNSKPFKKNSAKLVKILITWTNGWTKSKRKLLATRTSARRPTASRTRSMACPTSRPMWTTTTGKNYFKNIYRKVASSNMSRSEAHAGFFRFLMKEYFWSLCTVTFWQKIDFLISNAC